MMDRKSNLQRGEVIMAAPGSIAGKIEGTLVVSGPDGSVLYVLVEDLIAGFEPVAEDALEESLCPCCNIEYGFEGGQDVEHPLRMPCGHVVGNKCLMESLPDNSCSKCGQKLFDGPTDQRIYYGEDQEAEPHDGSIDSRKGRTAHIDEGPGSDVQSLAISEDYVAFN